MKTKLKTLAMVATVVVLTAGMVACEEEEVSGNSSNSSSGGGSDAPAGFVDLGLPSGLLWATCNVGATTPEGYGDYYAWGETSTKTTYNWTTYRYGTVDASGELDALTKYSLYGMHQLNDGRTTLESEDDAATAVLGGGARTPTKTEWEELLENTTNEWATVNDVNGWKFSAANGNNIFLPAAGKYYGSTLENAGTFGYYWSSTLDTTSTSYARLYGFSENGHGMGSIYNRYYGFTVRAVRDSQK
ncbi:MAG: hypothetical protein IJU19_00145 [Bacteroidales bacterium]|nr:hypothetical protein [Bacteroidales bacterium]